jgi:AraC-like DNA-binding protein
MINTELQTFIHYNHPSLDYVLPQSHSCYELVFYANGHGRTTVNNEIYNYKDLDMVLIAPNVVHDEKSEVSTEVYCCLFNLQGIELQSLFIKSDHELSSIVHEKMKEIRDAYYSRESYFESYINSLIQQIVILIVRKLSSHEVSFSLEEQNSRAIELSKKLLKEKLYLNTDLKVIAENIGYSYDYFRHIFKEYVGMSPKQYQLEQKLNRAKELLLNTTISIQSIAKQCGFGSGIAFNDFFKVKLKITPLKFRKLGLEHVDKVLLE